MHACAWVCARESTHACTPRAGVWNVTCVELVARVCMNYLLHHQRIQAFQSGLKHALVAVVVDQRLRFDGSVCAFVCVCACALLCACVCACMGCVRGMCLWHVLAVRICRMRVIIR